MVSANGQVVKTTTGPMVSVPALFNRRAGPQPLRNRTSGDHLRLGRRDRDVHRRGDRGGGAGQLDRVRLGTGLRVRGDEPDCHASPT